jgi:hypothetical protein
MRQFSAIGGRRFVKPPLALCIGMAVLLQQCQQRASPVQTSAPHVAEAPASPNTEAASPAPVAPGLPMPPKTSRSPVEQKMDSRLIAAVQMARSPTGDTTRVSTEQASLGLEIDAQGNVHVDIEGKVGEDLLSQIRALCGTVESSFPNYGTVRAWIPLLSATTLASRTDVSFIKPAESASLNSGSAIARSGLAPDQTKGGQDAAVRSYPSGNATPRGDCKNQH